MTDYTTVLVEKRADVLPRPPIEQDVAGPAVEAERAAVAGQPRHVADAADVHHHARLARVAEHGVVERGDERRALASRGHVAAAEVGHHVDAGVLREPRGIVDLDGEAQVRAMPHGLPMAADRRDRRALDAAGHQDAFDGARVEIGELEGDAAREVERIAARLAQLQDALAQLGGERDGGEGEGERRGLGEVHQRRVGAVEARARHHAHEETPRRDAHAITRSARRRRCSRAPTSRARTRRPARTGCAAAPARARPWAGRPSSGPGGSRKS